MSKSRYKTKRQKSEYMRAEKRLFFWEKHYRQTAMKQIREKQEGENCSKAEARRIIMTEDLRGILNKINRVRKNLRYSVIVDAKELIF